MRNLQIFVGIVLLAGPANAHPHIFIDTQSEVKFDAAGLAEGIRVTWSYDDLTSLQVIADRNMDDDFDRNLTAAETAEISGFDMDWEDG